MKNRIPLTKKLLLSAALMLSFSVVAADGDDSGSDLGAGLDWNYKGKNKTYQVAYVIWADKPGVGAWKDAEVAANTAYKEVLDLLLIDDVDVKWNDVYTTVTKDYGDGKVFAVKADPNAGKQRVTHEGWYPFTTVGWGFSILANLDKDGYITDFAINQITKEEIESRAIFKDGISIHDNSLTYYTMPSRAIINNTPCRTSTEIIEKLEECEKDDGLAVRTEIVLSECRLKEDAIKAWLEEHKCAYEYKREIVDEENKVYKVKAAPAPEVVEIKVEEAPEVIEPKKTVVAINNAISGFSYRVLDTLNLDEPFACNFPEVKIAEDDGYLAFEIPIYDGEPKRFYKIEAIGDEL